MRRAVMHEVRHISSHLNNRGKDPLDIAIMNGHGCKESYPDEEKNS